MGIKRTARAGRAAILLGAMLGLLFVAAGSTLPGRHPGSQAAAEAAAQPGGQSGRQSSEPGARALAPLAPSDPSGCRPGFSIVPSATSEGNPTFIMAAVALAPDNVWAVGTYYSQPNGDQRTFIEHWNGTQWSLVTSPYVGSGNNGLVGITAVSPTDIWAVGYQTSTSGVASRTLTLHWNGVLWSVVPSPNLGQSDNTLTAASAVSTNNVWAVGSTQNETLVLH